MVSDSELDFALLELESFSEAEALAFAMSITAAQRLAEDHVSDAIDEPDIEDVAALDVALSRQVIET